MANAPNNWAVTSINQRRSQRILLAVPTGDWQSAGQWNVFRADFDNRRKRMGLHCDSKNRYRSDEPNTEKCWD